MRRLASALATLALLGTAGCSGLFTPSPGRVSLNNFRFERAHVETVVTSGPSCDVRQGGGFVAASDFLLPLNGTRLIEAPAGSAVCWRHDLDAEQPNPRHWSAWSRAFPAPGYIIESIL